MPTKVVMEALSPTMEEGRLVRWLKPEGSQVVSGDVLAEVETDKAVMELAARADGVLRKQLVPEGTTAPVGQLLAVIAGPDEDISALLGAVAPKKAPEAKQTGAAAAGAAGGVGGAAPRKEEVVAVATPTRVPAGAPTPVASQPPDVAGGNGGRVRSSPLARRLASERGLDLQAVSGSGPAGRIIKRDIEQAATAPNPPAPARSGTEYKDVPLTQIRRTIARRLAESLGPIPTFYLTAEYDVTRITEMRTSMLSLGDDYKVSLNDIILKAVATAIHQHPAVNAHWLGDAIRYYNPVHLGMAVAIEDGLITPVIFNADTKSLRDLSKESKDLAQRARARKLTPPEYTGSTFSVSNLGMFGIDQFTAIINPPEAAILAIGAAEPKPSVVDGKVEIRHKLRVTLSCDHRVIDGATGAQFLRTLRQLIENPLLLVY
jgi:pyruvate dehydrogenase E2 component (dihydrolipoamide acetyltransferase)